MPIRLWPGPVISIAAPGANAAKIAAIASHTARSVTGKEAW